MNIRHDQIAKGTKNSTETKQGKGEAHWKQSYKHNCCHINDRYI